MKRMTLALSMVLATNVAGAQAQVGPMTTCVTEETRDRGFLRIPQRRSITRCTTTTITGMPGFGGAVGAGGYVGAGLVGMPISPAYVASEAMFQSSEQRDAWLYQRLYGQVPVQQTPAPATTPAPRTQASPRPATAAPATQPATTTPEADIRRRALEAARGGAR